MRGHHRKARQASVRAAAIVGAMLVCAGCGIRDPYLGRVTSTTTSTATSTTTASTTTHAATTSSTVARPSTTDTDPANEGSAPGLAPPGAPGSARNVVYQFALAYANVSAATIDNDLRTMIALATSGYATTLRRSAGQAQFAAIRGLPPGAQMVAQILSIQLSTPQGSFEHAAVTMQVALTQADASAEQPFTSTYDADLLRSGGAWRIADFGGQG